MPQIGRIFADFFKFICANRLYPRNLRSIPTEPDLFIRQYLADGELGGAPGRVQAGEGRKQDGNCQPNEHSWHRDGETQRGFEEGHAKSGADKLADRPRDDQRQNPGKRTDNGSLGNDDLQPGTF